MRLRHVIWLTDPKKSERGDIRIGLVRGAEEREREGEEIRIGNR